MVVSGSKTMLWKLDATSMAFPVWRKAAEQFDLGDISYVSLSPCKAFLATICSVGLSARCRAQKEKLTVMHR